MDFDIRLYEKYGYIVTIQLLCSDTDINTWSETRNMKEALVTRKPLWTLEWAYHLLSRNITKLK